MGIPIIKNDLSEHFLGVGNGLLLAVGKTCNCTGRFFSSPDPFFCWDKEYSTARALESDYMVTVGTIANAHEKPLCIFFLKTLISLEITGNDQTILNC